MHSVFLGVRPEFKKRSLSKPPTPIRSVFATPYKISPPSLSFVGLLYSWRPSPLSSLSLSLYCPSDRGRVGWGRKREREARKNGSRNSPTKTVSGCDLIAAGTARFFNGNKRERGKQVCVPVSAWPCKCFVGGQRNAKSSWMS